MSKTQNDNNHGQQKIKIRNKASEHTKHPQAAHKKSSDTAAKKEKKEYSPPGELALTLVPIIFVLLAFFIALCLFAPQFSGWLGKYTKITLAGLFSWGAYLLPPVLIIRAYSYKREALSKHPYRNWIMSLVMIVLFSAIVATAKIQIDGFNPIKHFASAIKDGEITTGSMLGGFISNIIRGIIGRITAFIILIIGFVIVLPYTINKSPVDLIRFITRKIASGKEKAKERKEYFEKKEAEEEKKAPQKNQKNRDTEPSEIVEKTVAESKAPNKHQDKFIDVEGPGDPSPDIDDDDDKSATDTVGVGNDKDVKKETEGEVVIQEAPKTVSSSLKSIFSLQLDPQAAKQYNTTDSNLEEIEAETDINSSSAPVDQKDAADKKDPDTTDIVTPLPDPSPAPIDATVKTIEVGSTSETATPTDEGDNEPEDEYRMPPIHLLKMPEPITAEMDSEYEQTAKKLVDTLSSFGVKTKISNIAKGPTVTRYELQPEIGVRVRSIRNLADDIALSLAAKGVRIEAPIPGKEAVGIEVPNKNTSVVSIRSLIDSPTFSGAKSKLTTALGVDVAGNPVYCDVSKMPHMMIAGTTGSGKSVCINSILVSILYKARPDEVKLILIDPKKIELGVYNGIAHLLVPVVSDPKNAAGALAWSVNEMERRFALIEETGVRDIKAYNEVALREGNREVLPHIVIIIDELADLMMMARDTVESSIARIAQKARAAGMHLIIGTQRPSVDVITGLIKANVPSRIAFTVASQVDSRTIIDVVGAEKLVGKGDMLYAPVGAMTPMRVQGAFVSDKEIESVISFLKGNSGAEYDEEIMDSIEKEAAKCEKAKSKSMDSDEDFEDDGDNSLNSDPMLRPAIEIAIDSGTISTSMLQRRLKLGYARAARLIDKMEALGIVSEFAGSKPRTVLISHEKYMEMVANSES